MTIIEINEGAKIPFEASKTSITFDDDLSINLAKREQDWDTHIDVCYDQDRELVIGAAVGRSYVAQIDIPARRYKTVENGEEQERVPLPFDMDAVTMSLWAIE